MRLLCGDETIDIEVRDGEGEARVTVAGRTFRAKVCTRCLRTYSV